MSVSSDAELMLKMADNAVLIVRQDWTDVRATNDASDTIRQTGVDFTGFILNAFLEKICGIRFGSTLITATGETMTAGRCKDGREKWISKGGLGLIPETRWG